VQADRARFALIVGFCVTCAACGKEGANASDALGGASGGATGGAPASSDLPLLLYDRDDDDPTNDFGDNRPTVITHHGDSLYWVELASEGPRIMRAPKDGSAQPRQLGTRSAFDVAKISASARYVFWQDNGTLVAYELQTDTRRDIGKLIDDGYGGPSLAIGDGWAAFADSSCRSVATVNLETWEVTQVKVHSDLRGGGTGLTSIGSQIYCANGPDILQVSLGGQAARTVWSVEGQIEQDEYRRAVDEIEATPNGSLLFLLSRTNKARSVAWTSLQVLDPQAPPERAIQEFEGISSVRSAADPELALVFYAKPALGPIHAVDLARPNEVDDLPGLADPTGPIVADDDYVFWAETSILSDRPNAKNAIYRQKKPK